MGLNNKNQTKAITDLFDIVLRYRWRLIIPAFVVAALVLTGSLLLPRKYKAEAIFERHTKMVMEQIMAKGAPQAIDAPRQSLTEEIAGQTAIDDLFEKIGPQFHRRAIAQYGRYDPSGLRNHIKKDVVVTPMLSTKSLDRISVSYVAGDPDIGRMTVNALVQNYIDRTHAKLELRLKQTVAFFSQEVDRSKKLIEELENKQLEYQIQYAELLPENAGNVQLALGELETELATLRQQREGARMRYKKLKQRLEMTPLKQSVDVTAANPQLTLLEEKKRDLENRLELYVGQYGMTAKHPDLISLRTQLAILGREIEQTTKTVVTQRQLSNNPKHNQLDVLMTTASADAEALDKQITATQNRIAQFTAQSAQLFPVRSEYRKLERCIEQVQRQLAFWEDNLRRISLTQTAEAGGSGVHLEFVKPCTQISKPVSPNLTQVLLVAISLGVMAGGISVFSAYRSDESFLDGNQLVQAFNLPLFGSVSEIISSQQRRMRHIRNTFLYPSSALAMASVLVALAGILYTSLEKLPPTPRGQDQVIVNPASPPAGDTIGAVGPSQKPDQEDKDV